MQASGSHNLKRQLAGPVIQFVTTTLLMALLFGVLMRPGELVYVWPVTGIQLGLLLHSRSNRAQQALDIAGASAAIFLGMFLAHTPCWAGLLVAIIQGLELWLAVEVMGGRILWL